MSGIFPLFYNFINKAISGNPNLTSTAEASKPRDETHGRACGERIDMDLRIVIGIIHDDQAAPGLI